MSVIISAVDKRGVFGTVLCLTVLFFSVFTTVILLELLHFLALVLGGFVLAFAGTNIQFESRPLFELSEPLILILTSALIYVVVERRTGWYVGQTNKEWFYELFLHCGLALALTFPFAEPALNISAQNLSEGFFYSFLACGLYTLVRSELSKVLSAAVVLLLLGVPEVIYEMPYYPSLPHPTLLVMFALYVFRENLSAVIISLCLTLCLFG